MTTATLPILAYDQVISGHCHAPAGPPRAQVGDSGLSANGRLRRVRLPAATLAQLRTWFDDTAVTLDHIYTCGYAGTSDTAAAPARGGDTAAAPACGGDTAAAPARGGDTAAAPAAAMVQGTRRSETFHDWVITGAVAGLFPPDVLQQITPLDAPHHPAPPDAYRLSDAAAPLRRAS